MFSLKGSFNYTCMWPNTLYGQNLQKVFEYTSTHFYFKLCWSNMIICMLFSVNFLMVTVQQFKSYTIPHVDVN